MKLRVVLLLVLPLLLIGGRTAHKPEWVHWLKLIDTPSLTASERNHIPPCIGRASHDARVDGADTARHACYGQPGRAIQLTRFGIVVTEPLNDSCGTTCTEDCKIELVASDTASSVTGTAIASSEIQVGQGNADSGNCGATLDAVGEFCMLDLDQTDDTTLVNAGGWYTVNVTDGDSGATCSELEGVQLVLWGYPL